MSFLGFNVSSFDFGSVSLVPSKAIGNGTLLTMISRLFLHGGYRAIFMSQKKLFQLCHFVSQQGDFTLKEKKIMNFTMIKLTYFSRFCKEK